MQPGDTSHRLIQVTSATGAAVTGLTLAAFTVTAHARAYTAGSWSTYAHGAALVEIGSGLYALSFSAPAAAGWWRLFIASNAGHTVWSQSWEGEVEALDQDALGALVIVPTATLTADVQLGAGIVLETIAYRQRELIIPVLDQAGNPYTTLATDFPSASLRLSVRSNDQTSTKWDAGPSGVIGLGSGTAANFAISTSSNLLSITIPEDAGFFGALLPGAESQALRWEVTGDFGGAAAKTRPIIRSSLLNLLRREVGT